MFVATDVAACMVAIAQSVEHLVVVQGVAGSSPVSHPTKNGGLPPFFRILSKCRLQWHADHEAPEMIARANLGSYRRFLRVGFVFLIWLHRKEKNGPVLAGSFVVTSLSTGKRARTFGQVSVQFVGSRVEEVQTSSNLFHDSSLVRRP